MSHENSGAVGLRLEASDDIGTDVRQHLIDTYLNLTRDVLPALAHTERRDWPVRNDHCFQRIVLDNICGGVWYAHLQRPAYKHLTQDQARRAVALSRDIADGKVDLHRLNDKSLAWRGKRPAHRRKPLTGQAT